MAIKNSKELFVLMLSDLRQNAERTPKIFQELNEAVDDPDVKEALNARIFVAEKVLSEIDKCFELIGAKPVKLEGRLQEIFVEDFRRELAAIQSPEARRLYVLAKANHLNHLRIGEYIALIAAAELTGHYGVGVLLESCLADKVAFVDKTKQLIREKVRERIMAA